MDAGTREGTKIVVGIDGSANSAAAFAWAVGAAKAHDASIEAAYVWQVPSMAYTAPGYIPLGEKEITDQGRAALDYVMEGTDHEGVKIHLHVAEGLPIDVLCQMASEPEVSLVVVGSRGHGGVAGLLLGSVSHALTHRCPKPLVVVPGEWRPQVSDEPILVGVDASPCSKAALRWAIEESRARRVALDVMMVWETASVPQSKHAPADAVSDTGSDAKLHEILEAAVRAVGAEGVEVRYHVVPGQAARMLTAAASSAQLLVVGTRGHGRAREALSGSVSHSCTHHTTVPVAVIHDQTDR